MNKIQINKIFAKIYLLSSCMQGNLYLVKDFCRQDIKAKINRSIKHTESFLKEVERAFKYSDAEEYAEDDTEMLDNIFESFIEAEENGILLTFKNDFNMICKKNGLKAQV